MFTKVHTVLGLVDSEEIGITHTHEHLSEYSDVYFKMGKTEDEILKSTLPWTLENVHWIRQFPYIYKMFLQYYLLTATS